MSAPAGGGLAEVLALLAKATPEEWHVGETLRTGSLAVVGDGDSVVCEFPGRVGGAEKDAAAIAAAVNYLRSHGDALAELIEAATELRQRQRDYLADPKDRRQESKGRLVGIAADRLDAALAKVASNGDTK